MAERWRWPSNSSARYSLIPTAGKWTIIATHNALQAFMVAAVSGSDLLGAMTERYARHWREQYEKDERPTQPERLASLRVLFDRIQHLKTYVDSQSFHPTKEQARSVNALNRWRDDFVHYKPGSMSIEVSGYPEIIRGCLEVIQFLAFDSRHVFRIVDESSDRTQQALEEAWSSLGAIEQAYGSKPEEASFRSSLTAECRRGRCR